MQTTIRSGSSRRLYRIRRDYNYLDFLNLKFEMCLKSKVKTSLIYSIKSIGQFTTKVVNYWWRI